MKKSFKEFIDVLVLESLDTKFDHVSWQVSASGLETFAELNGDKFKLSIETFQFKEKIGVNLGFGILDEHGEFNEKHVSNLHSTSSEIFGAVMNAFIPKLGEYELDFIVAIAANDQPSRIRLYDRLQKRFSKLFGMGYNTFKSSNNTIYVSSAGSVNLHDLIEWLKNHHISKNLDIL